MVLSRNFRSRREVLEATNTVFADIMSREMGEMDYTAEERLYFGADYYTECGGPGDGDARHQRGGHAGAAV